MGSEDSQREPKLVLFSLVIISYKKFKIYLMERKERTNTNIVFVFLYSLEFPIENGYQIVESLGKKRKKEK